MTPNENSSERHEQLDAVLERVYQRGYVIRRRRRMMRFVHVTLVLAMVMSGGAFGLTRLGAGNTGLVADEPSVSLETSDDGLIFGTAGPPVPSLSLTASPTPSPSECLNSTDPACGPFRWNPSPRPNKRARVTVRFSPENPTEGQEITFIVSVADADAPQVGAYVGSMWGDGTGVGLAPPMKWCPAYGPWAPPQPKPGADEFAYRHTYTKPGTFNLRFWGVSKSIMSGCAPDPYGDEVSVALTVVVKESQTTSPSPPPTPSSPDPTANPTRAGTEILHRQDGQAPRVEE